MLKLGAFLGSSRFFLSHLLLLFVVNDEIEGPPALAQSYANQSNSALLSTAVGRKKLPGHSLSLMHASRMNRNRRVSIS
jgi:hypothetical protein